MKKNKKKNDFLNELRKVPIILVACEKVGLSRTSVYRWRDDDPEFKKEMEEAMAEGEAFVNDMSESQVMTLIKEKNWSAISFWLRHHHPTYRNRIEIETIKPQEELTPEQEELFREAINLSPLPINEEENNESTNTNENTGSDDQGQSIEKENNEGKS